MSMCVSTQITVSCTSRRFDVFGYHGIYNDIE